MVIEDLRIIRNARSAYLAGNMSLVKGKNMEYNSERYVAYMAQHDIDAVTVGYGVTIGYGVTH